MLIVRDVFTAKPGQATRLAKLFARAFGNNGKVRVLTDLVGDYNTVVMETEVADLAEFENRMEEHRSGQFEKELDPELVKEMKQYTEMFQEGRREILQTVE